MPKSLPRKGKLRSAPPSRKPRDTLDVWALLAEDVSQHNPEGWFSIPWKDGRNVARMLTTIAAAELAEGVPCAVATALEMQHTYTDVDGYMDCQDLRDQVMRADVSPTLQTLCVMRLRAMQLFMSNSHGGGHGYNTVLLRYWHKLVIPNVDAVARAVAAARASDALGWKADARRVEAFKSAWDAGLFRAAYALG